MNTSVVDYAADPRKIDAFEKFPRRWIASGEPPRARAFQHPAGPFRLASTPVLPDVG